MKLDLKKTLLAGTAVVAIGGFVGSAQAADLTLTGDSTWGTTAPVNAPTAGDNVELDGFNLAVDESDNTQIGAITDNNATPDGNVTFDSDAGDGADLAVTVGSATLGTGNFVVQATENTASANGDATSVTVTGAISTSGNVTVTGGTNANNSSDAGDNATLTVGGNITAAGIAVTDGADGAATLVLNGTSAQTVAGVVSGDGDLTISNTHASGVTFSGDNTNTGTWTVNNDGNDQAITISGDNAAAIALGDNSGADTIAATFSGTSLAISGGITGGAAETVNVTFAGGDTITLSGAATSGVDTATVSGSTTVTTNQNFTATNIVVGSGSTFATTANTVTGAIANAGTVTMGGGDITGNITGAGTLSATADGTLTGSVANAVTIADNVTLTVDGTTGNETISGMVTINDSGVDDGLAIDDQGNTITVSGAVKTGTDGQGLVSIADSAGTVAFTGNVGTSSAALGALTVAGGTGNTVTTTGNLYVDAITLNDADTLQFLGDGTAQAVSGTITDGILAVGDATTDTTVTFSGALSSLASITVNDDATAIFAADATTTGALSADAATLQVNAGKTLTAATQTDADVTTWNIGVDKTSGTQTNGTVVLSGDAVNLAVDTVHFQVEAGSQPLTTGASVLDDVFQGNAAATIAGATVTDNSYLYDFALVADTNNVDVTVSQANSINSTAVNTANANVGNVLVTTLASSTNTQINQIQGNIAAASSADAVNEVLEAAHATVDGGHVIAGMTVSGQSLGIASQRLASLRDGSAETGMAAGNHSQGLKAWGQVFGQTASQDRRDGIDGYDSDTYGVAVGLDSANVIENGIVGLAFSYGNTNIDSDNANATDTDVDSYQLTLYGDYSLDENTYLNGMVAYGWHSVDTTRHNVGGVSGLTANGDFDADQFVIQAEMGRDYQYGENTTLTPNVLANYTFYSADDYTETGAGGANLAVNNEDLSVFELGLGLDASWLFENVDGSYVEPEIRVGARYDLIGDEVETTSSFTGAPGTSFKTQGFDPAQATFNIGAGVKYYSTDNWELTANYDFEVKQDYDSHAGFLRAAYKF